MQTRSIVLIGSAIAAIGGTATVLVTQEDGTGVCLPDDGLDDRECVQAQIDAACARGGGTIHFQSGRYEFAQDPRKGLLYNAAIRIECSDITLEGEGGAELALVGDAGQASWHIIRVTAHPTTHALTQRVEVSGLTLTTGLAFNTEEQTHALTVSGIFGPVSGVSLHHLRIRNKWTPGMTETSGDCIRLTGEPTGPVTDIDIGSVRAEECDRAGVSVQRNVSGVNIHDSIFTAAMKVAIDFEPTGPVGSPVTWFQISGNRFYRGVSLAGRKHPDNSTRISFVGNGVSGRVGVLNAGFVELAGNHIEYLAIDAEPPLAIKASEVVILKGNTVRRLADATSFVPGPALKIGGVSGAFPGHVTVDGGYYESQTDGHVIDIESAQDMTLADLDVVFAGPTASTWSGVKASATGRNLDRIKLADLRIKGPLKYAVQLAGSGSMVGTTKVSDLMSSGATAAGLRCENPLKFLKPVAHSGGTYDGAAVAASGCP